MYRIKEILKFVSNKNENIISLGFGMIPVPGACNKIFPQYYPVKQEFICPIQ